LQEEIEQFKRKSYVEQFEDLEKTFGLKLKEFERWPQFVECSQRRNILTHCDGVVSGQYLKICKENGYQFSSLIKVGDRLSVDIKYFFSSCKLLTEVAFKLCQTLWRKVLKDELSEADKCLNSTIYDMLLSKEWKQAQIFGEFAVKLPQFSSDVEKKIATMNYVMSIKFDGAKEKAKEILNATDWSASSYDFKIAKAILIDDFDGAAKLMITMGSKGELIDEYCYHMWPLFFEFRQSEQFIKAFKKIYKHPFIDELQKKAEL
jgi:hypothetical protein